MQRNFRNQKKFESATPYFSERGVELSGNGVVGFVLSGMGVVNGGVVRSGVVVGVLIVGGKITGGFVVGFANGSFVKGRSIGLRSAGFVGFVGVVELGVSVRGLLAL
jgi:hypothetical protein